MKNQPLMLSFFRRETAVFLFFFLFAFGTASAQHDSLLNTVTLTYDHTRFDRQFADDWRLSSLEYKRQFGFGALLARVNHASRFGRSGWQSEVEAYPVLSKKLYAYAGISYANDLPVFPRWRAGTTVYYTVAKGWEAEGGFRYLSFDGAVWLGTAGVSKYLGPWLFNARTFFSVDAPIASQSFFLKAQRFLKNEKDYVWLQAGSGVSPDESRSIQLAGATKLLTRRLNAGAKVSISNRLQLALAAGYARDEYQVKTFGNQYNGSVGMGVRF